MNLHIDIDRGTEGRWLAEVTDLPGAMTCAATRAAALALAKASALRALADRIDHGELRGEELAGVHFSLAPA